MGVINKVILDEVTHVIASSALATCETAAATSSKVATVNDGQVFTLITGTTIQVKFIYSNTASSPTLNVNGTGAYPIYRYGTTAIGNQAATSWSAGSIVSFTFDGTGWVFNGYQLGTGSGVEQENSDWEANTGVSSILNKPAIPSMYSDVGAASVGHSHTASTISWDGDSSFGSTVQEAIEYVKDEIPAISLTARTTNGTNIASITLNGTTTQLYAPTASGGSYGADEIYWTGDSSFGSDVEQAIEYVYDAIPSASAVSVTARTTIGTNIASITVDGTVTELYAPTAEGTTQVNADWEAVSGLASIYNKPNLAAVATTGSYNDLSDTPLLDAGNITFNDEIFVDWNVGSDVESALSKLYDEVVDIESDVTSLGENLIPTDHASTASTYGVGDSTKYGHLRLSDSTTLELGVDDGYAATPSAVANLNALIAEVSAAVASSTISVGAAYSAYTDGNSNTYLGYISANGETTRFYTPNIAGGYTVSYLSTLDEDTLLTISSYYTQRVPVYVYYNGAIDLYEESISYIPLTRILASDEDGIPTKLQFTGVSSSQIHTVTYDSTASSALLQWEASYQPITTASASTASIETGDKLLVYNSSYPIKTTTISFGTSGNLFLGNDGEWHAVATDSSGGNTSMDYTNGVLSITIT